MRIGILSAANSVHTVKIANGLSKLGHDVIIFSLSNHRNIDEEYDPSVVVIYLKHVGYKGYFLNFIQLKKLLNMYNIEVLNAHFASGYGTLASLVQFHPYALSVWGSDVYEFPLRSFLHKIFLLHNLNQADIIFSTSIVMAQHVKSFNIKKEILITPFGVDISKFKLKKHDQIKQKKINIGFVKNISPRYGIKELVIAFDRLINLSESKELQLSIYGEGTQFLEIKELIDKLHLNSNVTMYGRIPHKNVPEVLRNIDIFCAPSVANESFGVSVVEAMACGVPCITSDADGFTEVMIDEVTGFIVPKRDIDALLNRLMQLVNDEDLRLNMGKAGRAKVMQHYNWVNNVKIIEKGLSNII